MKQKYTYVRWFSHPASIVILTFVCSFSIGWSLTRDPNRDAKKINCIESGGIWVSLRPWIISPGEDIHLEVDVSDNNILQDLSIANPDTSWKKTLYHSDDALPQTVTQASRNNFVSSTVEAKTMLFTTSLPEGSQSRIVRLRIEASGKEVGPSAELIGPSEFQLVWLPAYSKTTFEIKRSALSVVLNRNILFLLITTSGLVPVYILIRSFAQLPLQRLHARFGAFIGIYEGYALGTLLGMYTFEPELKAESNQEMAGRLLVLFAILICPLAMLAVAWTKQYQKRK